ncbi:YciI family protein [Paracoccus pacificus]|uniref:YciI family protein n=1 Tax=Paracoccus pacificus TaxID=1463598 RepID=A0ABW4R4R0_9RHOB
MFLAVIAADRPGLQALRAETKQRHMRHLDGGAPGVRVLQSGPLLSPDGSERGSLIVLKADSVAGAQSFVDADPYNQAGLFETVEIHPWLWRRGNPYLEEEAVSAAAAT